MGDSVAVKEKRERDSDRKREPHNAQSCNDVTSSGWTRSFGAVETVPECSAFVKQLNSSTAKVQTQLKQHPLHVQGSHTKTTKSSSRRGRKLSHLPSALWVNFTPVDNIESGSLSLNTRFNYRTQKVRPPSSSFITCSLLFLRPLDRSILEMRLTMAGTHGEKLPPIG